MAKLTDMLKIFCLKFSNIRQHLACRLPPPVPSMGIHVKYAGQQGQTRRVWCGRQLTPLQSCYGITPTTASLLLQGYTTGVV